MPDREELADEAYGAAYDKGLHGLFPGGQCELCGKWMREEPDDYTDPWGEPQWLCEQCMEIELAGDAAIEDTQ